MWWSVISINLGFILAYKVTHCRYDLFNQEDCSQKQKKTNYMISYIVIGLLFAALLFIIPQMIVEANVPKQYVLDSEIQLHPIENDNYLQLERGMIIVNVNSHVAELQSYYECYSSIIKTKGQPVLKKYKAKFVDERWNDWLILPNYEWYEIYVN